jgi:hypothetical protein
MTPRRLSLSILLLLAVWPAAAHGAEAPPGAVKLEPEDARAAVLHAAEALTGAAH